MTRLPLTLAAALVLLATACGGDGGAPEAQEAPGEQAPAEPVPMRVYVGVDTAYAPYWVAQSEGYFEEEGLDVELVQFTQGGEGADALMAGEVDAGGSGDATLLQRSGRGPITGMSILQESGDYLKLVVREEIDEVSQIEKIGIVPGSLSEYAAVRLLEHNEIPADQVEFVPAGPPELPPLLQRGDADAFVLWEPWPTQAQELGGKVLQRTKEFGYSYLFFLVVNTSWLEQNPEAAAAFVRAMARAAEKVEEDPQLAADVTEEEVQIPIEQSLTAVEQIDFAVRDFTDEDMADLERVADFLVDRDIVDERPDPGDAVRRGFTEEALGAG